MHSLKLNSIFQNNMILQREKPLNIWGEGSDGLLITVKLCGATATSTVKNNIWNCLLPPLIAGTNQVLEVYKNQETIPAIKLTGLSIGDIWVAGGQSNMEYFLRYDEGWEKTKALPVNTNIHMYNCPRLAFEGHEKDISDSGYWFKEGDKAQESFSAPGFSFARTLQPALNIPIGIIGCNWGGTTASAWLDESYLKEEPLSIYLKNYEDAIKDVDPNLLQEESLKGWALDDSPAHQKDLESMMYGLNEKEQEQWLLDHAGDPLIPMGPYHNNRPGGLYHEMLKKITPFAVKGVLWYQGESDSNYPEIYDKLFTSMIRCWRDSWKDQLPFLFVQLAPFGKWLDCSGENYPLVREKQEFVSKTVPGTGMVSIMDIGMYDDIHPKKKMEVGRRLALLARGMVYKEDILCQSPEFYVARREGNSILLEFLYTGKGLYCQEDRINGLAIIQDEEALLIDSAKIDRNSIILKFKNLSSSPCKVSFAQTDYVEVNLFNSSSLPVKPFHCVV